MGISISHGYRHLLFSSFHNCRRALASAAGIDLATIQGYGGTEPFPPSDPLGHLIMQSDVDGIITPVDCGMLAERMGELLPLIGKEKKLVRGLMKGIRTAYRRHESFGWSG
jgi:hypothetical protein